MDWQAIAKWVGVVIAAAVAAGLVIKLSVSLRRSSKSSVRIVSQKNNRAGGDIIAGDSVKKNAK
ncbi:hypothetical protein [Burkholderia sola]|uniref:hypothetical protein n=1 Tax=Burkholderia sola TaxID=2843302 RepID=UPI0023DDE111|nr:hypothetical protein [Burkholderia sola]MDF3081480.1 hypothetical protein [Burkholderia sola]